MELIFATHNQNKALEINKTLPPGIFVKNLIEAGITEDLAEDGDTLEANALQKAFFTYNLTNLSCFADDSGLEVEALNGEPGVYSARYAGPEKDNEKNIRKLLMKLENYTNRKAKFKTVIALVLDNREHYLFEGVVEGAITETPKGSGGFGYDPVFIPDGFTKTFAEMTLAEKIAISHRAIAVKKLVNFLTHNSKFNS